MPTYTVSLKDASAAYGKIGKDIHEAALKGLRKAATWGLAQIIVAIHEHSPPPIDRGAAGYLGGWQILPLPNGAMLYNDELQAIFIEYGVRADHVKIGRKLISALAAWGVRKGICADDEAEDFAWAVAHAFKKRGIFNQEGQGGFRILEGVMKRLPRVVRQEIERAIKQQVG